MEVAKKVRRNLQLLRKELFGGNPNRRHDLAEERIKEATKRFQVAFFRARGFLPKNPLAARDEIRKALREMEIIKEVISTQDFQHTKTMLTKIEDLLGKHEIEAAITKMEALWTFMLTKAFPPPPYIA